MDKYIRPTLAEFVGTALYVFVVCPVSTQGRGQHHPPGRGTTGLCLRMSHSWSRENKVYESLPKVAESVLNYHIT